MLPDHPHVPFCSSPPAGFDDSASMASARSSLASESLSIEPGESSIVLYFNSVPFMSLQPSSRVRLATPRPT